jgi:fermentation-respiration switch protein FrsA (DUF1100 family)
MPGGINMVTLFWIAVGLVALFCVYLVILGVITQRLSVLRASARDDNFKPGLDDPDTFPATGSSPFRTHARDGNVWWNSQPLERFEIESFDGLKLVGNLLRASKSSKRLAFVIHGHRCVSGEMGFIAKMYADRGYHVFMPDQRAHGKSAGKYIGMGYFERYDMLRWLHLVNEQVPGCEILLHGISMGAATVMMTAGERALPDNVVCGVEDCGYTDAYNSIYHHIESDMKWLPFKHTVVLVAGFINKLKAGYYFRACECLAPLGRAALPMLFIHGTHDPVVPFWMLKDLYDAHAGQKEILIVAGAPHGICYFWNTDEYVGKVLLFLEKYFSVARPV